MKLIQERPKGSIHVVYATQNAIRRLLSEICETLFHKLISRKLEKLKKWRKVDKMHGEAIVKGLATILQRKEIACKMLEREKGKWGECKLRGSWKIVGVGNGCGWYLGYIGILGKKTILAW